MFFLPRFHRQFVNIYLWFKCLRPETCDRTCDVFPKGFWNALDDLNIKDAWFTSYVSMSPAFAG